MKNEQLELCRAQSIELNAEDGELPTRMQVIPEPDAHGMILGSDGRKFRTKPAAMRRFAKELNRNADRYFVDVDHSRQQAVGWMTKGSAETSESGGVSIGVEWNALGKELLGDKRYRYSSPAFYVDGDSRSENGAEIKAPFEAIQSLTNSPNLSQLPALNDKQASKIEEDKNMEKELNETIHKQDVSLNALRTELTETKGKLAEAIAELNETKSKALAVELNGKFDSALREKKVIPAERDTLLKVGLNSVELFDEMLALRQPQLNTQSTSPSEAYGVGSKDPVNDVEQAERLRNIIRGK